MSKPWIAAGALLTLMFVAVGADRHGYNRAMDAADAAQARAVEAALQARSAQERQERALARQTVEREVDIRRLGEQVQQEVREYAREADNPLCFDDERMRRIRSALYEYGAHRAR